MTTRHLSRLVIGIAALGLTALLLFTGSITSAAKGDRQIYVNGVLSPLPISAGIDFDFVYATVLNADNIFTVRAIDRSGKHVCGEQLRSSSACGIEVGKLQKGS